LIIKKEEYFYRKYKCNICNTTHEIKINVNIIEDHMNYPFPYVFLHGELKNILTTLYIDKDFQIRGVDVHKLQTNENLFSKDHVLKITEELTKEIQRLNEENMRLTEELKKLKNKSI